MRHRLGIRLLIVVEPDTVSDRTHYAQSQRACRRHTQRKTPESHRRRRSRRLSARIETRVRTLYGRFWKFGIVEHRNTLRNPHMSDMSADIVHTIQRGRSGVVVGRIFPARRVATIRQCCALNARFASPLCVDETGKRFNAAHIHGLGRGRLQAASTWGLEAAMGACTATLRDAINTPIWNVLIGSDRLKRHACPAGRKTPHTRSVTYCTVIVSFIFGWMPQNTL